MIWERLFLIKLNDDDYYLKAGLYLRGNVLENTNTNNMAMTMKQEILDKYLELTGLKANNLKQAIILTSHYYFLCYNIRKICKCVF